MTDVIVTIVDQSFAVPEEKLCNPIKKLIIKGPCATEICQVCGRIMTNTPLTEGDAVAASEEFDPENPECSVTSYFKERNS